MAKNGFEAAKAAAADNNVYTFIDPWGFMHTAIGLAAYTKAVSESREAWKDSVGG